MLHRSKCIRSLVIAFVWIISLAPSDICTISLQSVLRVSEEARNTCLSQILTNVTIDQIDLSHFIHGSDIFLFHLLDCKVSGLHEYRVVVPLTTLPSPSSTSPSPSSSSSSYSSSSLSLSSSPSSSSSSSSTATFPTNRQSKVAVAGGKRVEEATREGEGEEDEEERASSPGGEGEKRAVKVTVSLGNVSMTGGYQVSGKLASLFPIQGDGLMSATFFNVTAATVLWMEEEKEQEPGSSSSSSKASAAASPSPSPPQPNLASTQSSTWTSTSVTTDGDPKHNTGEVGKNGKKETTFNSSNEAMKKSKEANSRSSKKKNHLAIRVDSIDLEAVEMKIESNDHKNALHEGYNEEASDSNITSTSLVDHSNHSTHHSYHSFNSFSSPSYHSPSNEAGAAPASSSSPPSSSSSSYPSHKEAASSHSALESMLFWRLVHSLQQKLELNLLKCLQEVIGDEQ